MNKYLKYIDNIHLLMAYPLMWRQRWYPKIGQLVKVGLYTEKGHTQWYRDSASKPLRDRPGGRRVLKMLESGKAEGLVFTKLDRAFRSTMDCINTVDTVFRAKGWQLASLAEQLDTSTSMGRLC